MEAQPRLISKMHFRAISELTKCIWSDRAAARSFLPPEEWRLIDINFKDDWSPCILLLIIEGECRTDCNCKNGSCYNNAIHLVKLQRKRVFLGARKFNFWMRHGWCCLFRTTFLFATYSSKIVKTWLTNALICTQRNFSLTGHQLSIISRFHEKPNQLQFGGTHIVVRRVAKIRKIRNFHSKFTSIMETDFLNCGVLGQPQYYFAALVRITFLDRKVSLGPPGSAWYLTKFDLVSKLKTSQELRMLSRSLADCQPTI